MKMEYRTERDIVSLGTYPKFIGKVIRWGLTKRLPTGTYIRMRGRGPRALDGMPSHRFNQDLPIHRAPERFTV